MTAAHLNVTCYFCVTSFLRCDRGFTFHLFPTNRAVNIGLRVNEVAIVYLNASSKGDLFEGESPSLPERRTSDSHLCFAMTVARILPSLCSS